MAFFDELGKKISITGQDAITKTRNMADTSKINSAISNEQQVINDCYKELGKQLYEKNEDLGDSNIRQLIDCINISFSHIADYKKQINELKGLAICPNCNTAVQKGSAYCPSCGSPMPQEVVAPAPAENAFTCPNCGRVVDPNLNFCVGCGTNIREAIAQAQAQAPVAPAPAEEVFRCPSCGRAVDPSLNFCVGCGAKLHAEPADDE